MGTAEGQDDGWEVGVLKGYDLAASKAVYWATTMAPRMAEQLVE